MPESYMGSRSQSHVTRQKRACMKMEVQQVYYRASRRLDPLASLARTASHSPSLLPPFDKKEMPCRDATAPEETAQGGEAQSGGQA